MHSADALAKVAAALQASGCNACLDDECVQAEFSGIPCAVTLEGPKLGFYCYIAADGLDLRLERLNDLNGDIQFAKFSLDSDGNLVLSSDFLLEVSAPNWEAQLERAVEVWNAALKELRSFVAEQAETVRSDAA
jgi:hypothetical protein